MTFVILEHRKFLATRAAFHSYRTRLAFSNLATRRIYLSSHVLRDRDTALRVITHELGHFVIQDGIESHAEFAAERIPRRARQRC
jgi:Zn-dependent protease with chaperone function